MDIDEPGFGETTITGGLETGGTLARLETTGGFTLVGDGKL